MSQKNKPRNPLTFLVNADPGAKCEKRGAKLEKSDAKHPAIGSVHPSESSTIAAFWLEKGERQLDEKGNVFNTSTSFYHAG